MAPTMPAIVGIVALETPPAIDFASPPPLTAITKKTSIMPVTVPISPNKGQIVTNTSMIGSVFRTSNEIFEIIILTLGGIGIIVIFIRMGTESMNWIKKWKELKAAREEKKYREYCAKFDATTSSVHHTGPKRITKTRQETTQAQRS